MIGTVDFFGHGTTPQSIMGPQNAHLNRCSRLLTSVQSPSENDNYESCMSFKSPLKEPLDYIPPGQAEANYHKHLSGQAIRLTHTNRPLRKPGRFNEGSAGPTF